VRHFDGLNLSIGIEAHFVDRDDALIRSRGSEGMAMIDDIPIVRARNLKDGVVARTICDGGVCLENLADTLERTGRAVASCIGDSIG
jgi:hypothetical protein